jgi:AcrR family transcriptional regulator
MRGDHTAMRRSDNRQRILDASLDLFSAKGYSNTSVRQLAQQAGIRESSVYNHFESKEAILVELVAQYDSIMEQFSPIPETMLTLLNGKSSGEILAMGMSVFETFFTNPVIAKLLRMLGMERFTNPTCANLYKKLLLSDAIDYQTLFFGLMIKSGTIRTCDPKQLAIMFFSPVIFCWSRFVESSAIPLIDPSRAEDLEEARSIIRGHVTLFGTFLDSLHVE